MSELAHKNVEALVDTSVTLNSHRLVNAASIIYNNNHSQENRTSHEVSHLIQSLDWNKIQVKDEIISECFPRPATRPLNATFLLIK